MHLLPVEPKVDVGLAPKIPPPEPNALVPDEGWLNILVVLVVPVWLVLGCPKVPPAKVLPPPPNAPNPAAGFALPKAPNAGVV